MRAQLGRIQEIAALPNVTLLLQFPEPGDTAIVYIEDQTTSQYLETPADIERYTLVFDHLRASALSPERSTAFIGQIATSPERSQRD